MSEIASKIRNVIPMSYAKWFTIWTGIGALFALQLRWHYELSWSLSLFWGFADYYLWSFIALAIFAGVKALKKAKWSHRHRTLVYIAFAPGVLAIHVLLTIFVDRMNLPSGSNWLGYISGLYVKKLTINALTFGALVAAGEIFARPQASISSKLHPTGFLAKRRDASRIVIPEQIIWGEVSGNYVNLNTLDGVWPVRQSLTQLVEKLPKGDFVKISRSTFISLANVKSIRSNAGEFTVMLCNEMELSVARRQQASVRKAILSHAQ